MNRKTGAVKELLKNENIDVARFNKEGKSPKTISNELKLKKIGKLLDGAASKRQSVKMLANDINFDR